RREAQIAQQGDVTEEEREHHVAKLEPMRTADQQRPLGVQRARLVLELGIALVQRAQVASRERMLLDGDIVQPATARRVVLPRAPGGEEIQAEAKAGFQND